MHNTVVIKICKELLNLDRNLIMISSYIPPPDSPANSLPNALSGIEILEQTVLELNDIITEEVYYLMCGDLMSELLSLTQIRTEAMCLLCMKTENHFY